jgi:hypothetical protein
LFSGFAGTTPMFDSSPAFMHGLCFGFPCRSGGPVRPRKPGEVSRFSRVQFLDVLMALGLRRICRELALAFPSVLPSRWKHAVGIRFALFEARFPARRCLCLHFTRNLTAPSARLEVKMVRYSFLVGLFHPRLHAGLSRRLRRGRDGRYRPPPAQTRACGATAHGSYFGCAAIRRLAWKRASGNS